MTPPLAETGGARIGWVNATYPFAKLTATPHLLQLTVSILGEFNFTPDAQWLHLS